MSRSKASLAKVVSTLMPDSRQVFVKVEGLFGHRGHFKLPMPVASALKGPVLFCSPNIAALELAAFGFGFFKRSFGELPLYTSRGFLH